MKTIIKQDFLEAESILKSFISDDKNFEKIEVVALLMAERIKSGNKIISCGNGGSMTDAMHFAEELTGRFRENRRALPAIAISDPSYLSCVANDYGYDEVFARFIEAFAKKGDILLAISTSGNSQNVIKACEKAKEKQMTIVGLTGKNGGEMKEIIDYEIKAPISKYADRAQEIHIKIIHSIINAVEKILIK